MAVWLLTGSLSSVLAVGVTIALLIFHEYAHLKECTRQGVTINSVTFTWLGGAVDADIKTVIEAVPVLTAGLKNTGVFTAGFIASSGLLYIYLYYFSLGINLAGNPYTAFFNSIALISGIMLLTNILPITYHHKIHGAISTDGWAAYKLLEQRNELWNDGKYQKPIYASTSYC